MRDGKLCPVCEKDIGIWAVFIAALPTRVTCPHCQARLRYAQTSMLVAVLLAGFLVCAAGCFFFVLRFVPYTRLEFAPLCGALVVAIWLPLELAVALYLRRAKKLSLAAPSDHSPAHDSPR